MQYYKFNEIGKCKIKPADFEIIPEQKQIFPQIRTLQVHAYAIHAKLSDKESVCHKSSLKRSFRFDHNNWYVNNMERLFFTTEIEARRELAHVGLISKHHYHPQIIQFDVLDNPTWQANIEAKPGQFQLHRYRPSLSNSEAWSTIHGTMNGSPMLQITTGPFFQVKKLKTNSSHSYTRIVTSSN